MMAAKWCGRCIKGTCNLSRRASRHFGLAKKTKESYFSFTLDKRLLSQREGLTAMWS